MMGGISMVFCRLILPIEIMPMDRKLRFIIICQHRRSVEKRRDRRGIALRGKEKRIRKIIKQGRGETKCFRKNTCRVNRKSLVIKTSH